MDTSHTVDMSHYDTSIYLPSCLAVLMQVIGWEYVVTAQRYS